jgi:hypothetical protein
MKTTLILALAATATALLGGCAVYPAAPGYGGGYGGGYGAAYVGPPVVVAPAPVYYGGYGYWGRGYRGGYRGWR